jgi:hypothetical protein
VSGTLFFVERKGVRYPFLCTGEAGGLRHAVEERVPDPLSPPTSRYAERGAHKTVTDYAFPKGGRGKGSQ